MKTNSNPAKHLYGRGWLGLIPLVGGFVGIGLIILGIFKYKDRKLIVIGSSALLFTIAIYGSLFYYILYSDVGRKQTAPLTQRYLNSLVKDIEFYKMINGTYPDSLEQLTKNNDITNIHDPLLFSPGIKDTKFNYQKIGNKYILFSSGIDRTLNTSDDIYPNIFISDSSKFGLIKIKK